MAWWTVPAIMAASKVLGGLFDKGKQEYELSPEARWLFNYMQGQVGKGAPSFLTRPISARYGAFRQGIKERMGEALGPGSGLETAQLMKATAGESREIAETGERYQMGLLSQLAGLVPPPTGRRPTDWASILGSAGAGFAGAHGEKQEFDEFMDLLKKYMGGGGSVPSIGGEGEMSYSGYGGKPEDWWD